jgi:hypothetical protein
VLTSPYKTISVASLGELPTSYILGCSRTAGLSEHHYCNNDNVHYFNVDTFYANYRLLLCGAGAQDLRSQVAAHVLACR